MKMQIKRTFEAERTVLYTFFQPLGEQKNISRAIHLYNEIDRATDRSSLTAADDDIMSKGVIQALTRLRGKQ